jgi:hypothetical protein
MPQKGGGDKRFGALTAAGLGVGLPVAALLTGHLMFVRPNQKKVAGRIAGGGMRRYTSEATYNLFRRNCASMLHYLFPDRYECGESSLHGIPLPSKCRLKASILPPSEELRHAAQKTVKGLAKAAFLQKHAKATTWCDDDDVDDDDDDELTNRTSSAPSSSCDLIDMLTKGEAAADESARVQVYVAAVSQDQSLWNWHKQHLTFVFRSADAVCSYGVNAAGVGGIEPLLRLFNAGRGIVPFALVSPDVTLSKLQWCHIQVIDAFELTPAECGKAKKQLLHHFPEKSSR